MSNMRKVGVTRLVEPRFLSLVGKPANTVAFKVVRSDGGDDMKPGRIRRDRPVKRSDLLLSFWFDKSMEDQEIMDTVKKWGITDASIEEVGNEKVVRCSDAPENADTMKIQVSDSCSVTMLKPISNQKDEQAKRYIAVSGIEFSSDLYTSTTAVEWMSENSVDFSEYTIQNDEQRVVVNRSVEGSDGETRRIEVSDGVVFLVERAEAQDIPQSYALLVNEAAFGNWGWGQLDFTSALADIQFSELADTALSVLRRVLDDLLFWSDLPINIRRDLITAATMQFSEYISGLVDALPQKMIVASRSHLQEIVMSKKENSDVAAQEDDNKAITREDVQGMVNEAMSPIMQKMEELSGQLEQQVASRQEDPGKTTEEDGAGDTKEQLDSIVRSVESLSESIKEVSERMVSLEGATVVRSDNGDGSQSEKRDVFDGMFRSRAN